MTVVDTSAIVALLVGETQSGEIERTLMASPCLMSAATRVELGIVIEAKAGPAGTQLLEELLQRAEVVVEPVGVDCAREAIVAWRRFGNGPHPAGLNLGDMFSYALARRTGRPLLFVGDTFALTDTDVG